MYLIDTSVWVDYLRRIDSSSAHYLNKLLSQNIPFGLTSAIYQEILQGAPSKNIFDGLADSLSTERFYLPKDPVLSYQAAAQIYFACRKKGITVRSTIDCLIAQIAIENNLQLLHNDKDFLHIQKIVPELKLVSCH